MWNIGRKISSEKVWVVPHAHGLNPTTSLRLSLPSHPEYVCFRVANCIAILDIDSLSVCMGHVFQGYATAVESWDVTLRPATSATANVPKCNFHSNSFIFSARVCFIYGLCRKFVEEQMCNRGAKRSARCINLETSWAAFWVRWYPIGANFSRNEAFCHLDVRHLPR